MKLKKNVEQVLFVLTAFIGAICVTVDDFDIDVAPYYLMMWGVFALGCYVLHKYGRGIFFENDNE